MTRRVLAALGLSALAIVLSWSMAGRAEPPVAANVPAAKGGEATQEDVARTTATAAREYKTFEDALVRIAQRMERSTRPEERDRAQALRKAIVIANNAAVENKFNTLVTELVGNKNLTIDEFREEKARRRPPRDLAATP